MHWVSYSVAKQIVKIEETFMYICLSTIMRRVILAAMKSRFAVLIATVLGGLSYAFYFSACEETLEACQPCVSVLDGATNIAGDPRIDGTFGAVKRVREFSQFADRMFQNETDLLIQIFDLPEDADVSKIVTTIEEQLLGAPGVTGYIFIEPATCWIDAAWAREQEFSCEERSECMIARACTETSGAPYCTGFFAGNCADNSCRGSCFQASPDDAVTCLEGCIGTCMGMTAGLCPGKCMGDCSETCTAYDQSASCNGYCSDLCTGSCEFDSAFVCNGQCEGLCQVTPSEDLSCSGKCRGTCLNEEDLPIMTANSDNGEIAGVCRGHVRPKGCDPEPACSECREMAMSLAWSNMMCTPAAVQVGLDVSGAAPSEQASLLNRARVLESILQRVAGDYAKLALWVDGMDVRGNLDPEDLIMTLEQDPGSAVLISLDEPAYVESLGVAEGSKFHPLSYLKARVGILVETATSGRVFSIAAVPLQCVSTSLDDAKNIMDQLIPVEDGDEALIPARTCPAPEQDEVAPCLYRIIDDQALLLGLSANVN